MRLRWSCPTSTEPEGSPDDRRQTTACRTAGEERRHRFPAPCRRERVAAHHGGRRGRRDRGWSLRAQRRAADLAQRLPRPDAGDAAGAAQPEDSEAEDWKLLPRLPGAEKDRREGVGVCHPGGMDRRGEHEARRRAGAGHGDERHLEVVGEQAVQGDRRARERLPQAPPWRRVALAIVARTNGATRLASGSTPPTSRCAKEAVSSQWRP